VEAILKQHAFSPGGGLFGEAIAPVERAAQHLEVLDHRAERKCKQV
jgi:hypothetical protein